VDFSDEWMALIGEGGAWKIAGFGVGWGFGWKRDAMHRVSTGGHACTAAMSEPLIFLMNGFP